MSAIPAAWRRRRPSVTQILTAVGLGPDLSRVPADILSAAQARGTAVHAAIEGEHYGFDTDLPPECKPYLDAYHRFCDDTKHEPTHSEFEVVSTAWGYEGHLDRVGWLTLQGYTGHRTLIDFKTGGADGVGYQLAGYTVAWNEQFPRQRIERAASVALRRDGTYRLVAADLKTATPVWLAAVVIFKARGGKVNGR